MRGGFSLSLPHHRRIPTPSRISTRRTFRAPRPPLTAMYAGLKIFGFWGLLLAPLGTTLLLHLRQGGYLRGEG